MKPSPPLRFVLAVCAAVLWLATSRPAQTRSPGVDRARMKQDIEIVENVLNTVRQQAITASQVTLQAKESGRAVLHLRTVDNRRSEGFYLDGYGVIFEVYLPNFSEQRGFSLGMKRPDVWVSTEKSRPDSVVTAAVAPHPGSTLTAEAKTESSPTALNTLSKLIESYTRQLQNLGKEAALRQFMEKLQEADFFPPMKVITTSLISEIEGERDEALDSKIELQKKAFQDSILKAIASYGSAIAQLQPSEHITVLLKAPVARDFSLFSSEAHTEKIMRVAVQDLQDYKTGKMAYETFLSRVKIEAN